MERESQVYTMDILGFVMLRWHFSEEALSRYWITTNTGCSSLLMPWELILNRIKKFKTRISKIVDGEGSENKCLQEA